MVGDDDFEKVGRQIAEAELDVEQLLFGDSAILPEAVPAPGPGAGGVDAEDGEVVIFEKGAEIFGDVLAIAIEGIEKWRIHPRGECRDCRGRRFAGWGVWPESRGLLHTGCGGRMVKSPELTRMSGLAARMSEMRASATAGISRPKWMSEMWTSVRMKR